MKGETPTLMVIENVNALMGETLRRRGYRVIAEPSLSQAMEDISDFTNRSRPDAVLYDLNQFQQEDSWMVNVLREGAREFDLPIIGFGEFDEELKVHYTKSAGFSELFHRPNDIGKLTALIDDLLARI